MERTIDSPLPQLLARSVRDAMGPIADAFWGHPSEALTVVGVTGTSGKTTTTHLLHAIFEAHGWSSSVLGHPQRARAPPRRRPSCRPTWPRERDAGRQAIAMEVSSHALAMGRVAATRFAVAVFTNLSHDHLDFHRDLEDYFEAKATLFTARYTDAAVVNLDDPRGVELARRETVPTDGYALADAEDLVVGTTSCTLPLARPRGRAAARRPLQREQRPRRRHRRGAARHPGRDDRVGVWPGAARCPGGSSRSTRASRSRCSSTTPTSPAPSKARSPPPATRPAAAG